MRITLVISSLALGGAERFAAWLAGALDRSGHAVRVLTLAPPNQKPFFPLPESVELCQLGLVDEQGNAFSRNLRRVRALRRAIREHGPDVVVSIMDQTNVLTLLACRGMNRPVVVCERTDPNRHDIGRLWSLLRRMTYPRAAAIAVQTKNVLKALPESQRRKGMAIPNPVPPRSAEGHPEYDIPGPVVAAMGRLVPVKGFDLLLQAFAKIADDHPGWTLAIFGEGPERPFLEGLVQKLGLEGRALLPGAVRDVDGQLRAADIFVLSSRYEGFPNALVEAMACGLPVIASDCDSGPREILEAANGGVLFDVDRKDELAATLADLMSSPDRRRELGQTALQVCEVYSEDVILARWLSLLENLLSPQ